MGVSSSWNRIFFPKCVELTVILTEIFLTSLSVLIEVFYYIKYITTSIYMEQQIQVGNLKTLRTFTGRGLSMLTYARNLNHVR